MRNPRGYHPRDAAPDATHMFSWLGKIFGRGAAADTGARGEALAADWLRRERGMTVVARNWRNPRDRRDELDLVCRDGEALVFVEVKTRAAGARVQGVHAVDARKRRVLRRAARAYLAGLPARPRTYRLDVVEVATAADGAAPVIRHFENLPLMGDGFRG